MPRNVSFYGKSAAPLYGRQIERDYQTDPRRLMAESILQKGVGPVQSPTEGMLKALQQGVAGYFAGQARNDMKAREERAGQGLLAALQGGQARPWVNPGAEPGFAPPGTVATARGPGGMVEGLAPVAGGSEYQAPPAGVLPASPVGQESTAPAGGYEGIMSALLAQNNPDLAPFAQQLAIGQMQQQAAQRQAEIARAQQLADMELDFQNKLRLKQTPGAPGAPSSRPAAPIQNFAERQRLVEQYGEGSGEVSRFDNYVRAAQLQNIGPQVVAYNPAAPSDPIVVAETGLKPGERPETKAAQAAASEAGGSAAKMNASQYQTALSGLDTIERADELINHLKTSDAITGMGAGMLKGIERAKAALGNKVAQGKVSDTEILDAMMGSQVFGMIKSLGIGARGLDTPAEREFMRSVLTGTIELDKKTLVKMAEIRRNLGQRAVDKWNQRVKKGELDNWFDASGIPREPLGGMPSDAGGDPLGILKQ